MCFVRVVHRSSLMLETAVEWNNLIVNFILKVVALLLTICIELLHDAFFP